MGTTNFTASVWGQGRQASALSAQAAKRMGKGEEECHICRDDVPATISFVPCKHKVCFGCVENMRAKNIFKADKGIRCPFCRQYVDGYDSLMSNNMQVQRFLVEANKAANTAAQARAVAENRALQQQIPVSQQQQLAPASQAVQQGSSSSSAGESRQASSAAVPTVSGEDQIWTCGSCSTPNYLWREFCSKCKKPTPRPYGHDKLSQTQKDIGSMSRFELLQLIQERGAFGLRRALADVGVTVDSARSYGSSASVRDAVAVYGIRRRMLHIAEVLDPMTLKDASCHHLGNFAVQRVLEAFAKVREAFPLSYNADVRHFADKHNGKDPFGALVAAIEPYMLEYCLNEKGGVYVVQCAANLCSNHELVSLGNAVAPLTLPTIRDPKGVFVLRTLMDLFSQRIWEDEDNREPALKCVDSICNQFIASHQQLINAAMHALSGKVLVKAIAIAMPRFPALQLAIKVASSADVLATLPGGLSTLTELLQLYGHNQLAMEGLRDVVTCMCYSLQGTFKVHALSHEEAAQEFLLCLIERLGLEQETGWLDCIAQELVGGANELCKHPAGLTMLTYILTQPVLDLSTVALHIADMRNVLDKATLVSVVADITESIAQNPGPPAPKYPAASVIQPELKYYLSKGWPTPLPPSPPPKPGTPGYQQVAQAAAAEHNADPEIAAGRDTQLQVVEVTFNEPGQQATPAPANSSSSLMSTGWPRAGQPDSSAASSRQTAAGVGTNAVGSSSGLTAVDSTAAQIHEGVSEDSSRHNPASNVWCSAGDLQQSSDPAGDPWASTWHSLTADNSNSSKLTGDQVTDGHAVVVPSDSVVTVAAAEQATLQPGGVGPGSIPMAIPVGGPASMVPTQSALGNAASRQPQQQRPMFGSAAVADFSTAAPARLNPGARPPPSAAVQQKQQQQQGQQEGSSNPAAIGLTNSQQQQQQQQQGQPVGSGLQQQQQQPQQHEPWSCTICTYEHTGAEANFLFCAMCSSERPDHEDDQV